MKVLVTGGLGFVGRHLVRRLSEHGHDVRVLDVRADSPDWLLPLGVERVIGDILDWEMLVSAATDVDVTYHLAAISSVPEAQTNPRRALRVNVEGTLNVLEAVKQHAVGKRIVFASSAAVYGDSVQIPQSESTPTEAKSLYAATKVSGEALVQAYSRESDLEGVILRLFNVYGDGQAAGSPYSGVITKCFASVNENTPFRVHGDGSQVRDFIHVADVVELCLRAGNPVLQPRPMFPVLVNCGTGHGTSVLELKRLVGEVTGCVIEDISVESRNGDVETSLADVTQAKKVFDWNAQIPLRDGLKMTYDRLPGADSSSERRTRRPNPIQS